MSVAPYSRSILVPTHAVAPPPPPTHDELIDIARRLGIVVSETATSDELEKRVARRREELLDIGAPALRELLVAAGQHPAHKSNVEDLAAQGLSIELATCERLPPPALETLARLHGIQPEVDGDRAQLIRRLRGQSNFWDAIRRGRRRMVARFVSAIIEEKDEPRAADSALVEPAPRRDRTAGDARKSLREEIESLGVVGGLATRIRGAADEYIQAKLDEIERRIDQKLNQIDERLAEWRDRELSHRLRILRVTLGFSVLVALVSLGYSYVRHRSEVRIAPSSQVLPAGDSIAGEP